MQGPQRSKERSQHGHGQRNKDAIFTVSACLRNLNIFFRKSPVEPPESQVMTKTFDFFHFFNYFFHYSKKGPPQVWQKCGKSVKYK